jgi:hypothetical protein
MESRAEEGSRTGKGDGMTIQTTIEVPDFDTTKYEYVPYEEWLK